MIQTNSILPGRPEPGEYAPYAQAYLDCLSGDDVLQALTVQMHQTQSLLAKVDDRRATEFAYAPGKWTLKQIAGHLIDIERIFAYRALSLARREAQTLPAFDQDAYIASANFSERPWPSLLDELAVVRQSTIALVHSFTQDAWLHRGNISSYTASPRGVIFVLAGHELHHHKILREKYQLT